jgi:hypothetical protein
MPLWPVCVDLYPLTFIESGDSRGLSRIHYAFRNARWSQGRSVNHPAEYILRIRRSRPASWRATNAFSGFGLTRNFQAPTGHTRRRKTRTSIEPSPTNSKLVWRHQPRRAHACRQLLGGKSCTKIRRTSFFDRWVSAACVGLHVVTTPTMHAHKHRDTVPSCNGSGRIEPSSPIAVVQQSSEHTLGRRPKLDRSLWWTTAGYAGI